jgi:hypothetical protein
MKPMRPTKFLRTPIRADHQSRITNLAVSEAAGGPLQLTFGVTQGVTEVQVAPLWQGELFFLSDDKSANPKQVSDVIAANFPAWKLAGELVLVVDDRRALQDGLKTGAPFIAEPPTLVRYSKVKLTQAFLFATLKASPFPFVDGGSTCKTSDPKWHEKLVIAFLDGRASLPCAHDKADDTQDFARRDMPSVSLTTGAATTFSVTIASQALEAKDVAFWQADPKIDTVPGVPLVPPALANDVDRQLNPQHPAASIISGWALFQSAEAAGAGAFASDQTAANALPLRTALGGARPDGLVYRRLDLQRPPLTVGSSSSYPRRPFPMYKLIVKPSTGAPVEIRIPLSGAIYLALDDGAYDVWAAQRDSATNATTTEFKLSQPAPVTVRLSHGDTQFVLTPLTLAAADTVVPIFAHLRYYDSARAFWASKGVRIKPLHATVKARYGDQLTVQDAFLFPIDNTMVDYAPVFGWIRQVAGRHRLAPEFLHAVLWREGLERRINANTKIASPRIPYDVDQVINGFTDIGLDQMLMDQDTIVETQKPAAARNPYVDPDDYFAVTPDTPAAVPHPENPNEQMWWGYITGWRPAIEIVAGEVMWRMDTMVAWCEANGVKVTTEDERRFLAESRYNGSLASAQTLAANLRASMQKFVGPEPSVKGPQKVRFNTLSTLATATYLEASGIYR